LFAEPTVAAWTSGVENTMPSTEMRASRAPQVCGTGSPPPPVPPLPNCPLEPPLAVVPPAPDVPPALSSSAPPPHPATAVATINGKIRTISPIFKLSRFGASYPTEVQRVHVSGTRARRGRTEAASVRLARPVELDS
jgi:hypothetical protein